MSSRYGFVLLCLGCTGWVHAEIYKSVDAEGRVTYSSTPSKGAKKLGLEPQAPVLHSSPVPLPHASSHAARANNHASPADFPKVDSGTQKRRDSARHKILADELAAEEKLLAEARANLKQGEVSGNETLSGAKLQALHEEVTLHEKNVSALKTELSSVK